MAWPTLTLEAAMSDDATAAAPTFDDLSSRLLDFTVTRGRSMELDQTETGTLTAVLRNHDRALDPANTAGTYYPDVVPVRQARMKATISAVTYDVFRGDIPDWPQDWKGRENTVPITMVDAFDALQIADFTASRPVELSGARVNAILDAIGWQAGLRSIDAGQAFMQAVAYENANALQAMQDVADAEGGVLFMSRAGNVVFHNRHRRIFDTTLQVTLSNEPSGAELPLADAKVVYRRERIRNTIAVTRNDGGTATVSDSTSQAKYRRRSLTKTVYLHDANEVQSMAEYLLATYKDPVLRVEEVMIEPQSNDSLWAHALGREIGDRIRVKIVPPGSPASTITSDVTIEGIAHASNRGERWVTTFRCSPSNTQIYWILGTGELGDTSGATNTRVGY
jgi:hypothetical protein